MTGVEPVRYRYRGILSPLCLPIPPHRQIYLVTRTRIELVLPPWKGGVLTAWPTGQVAPRVGLEPTTPWLTVRCSTGWTIGEYFVMFCVAQHHECYYTKSTRICQHFFWTFLWFFQKKFFEVVEQICLSSKNRSTIRISGFYFNYDFLYITCDFFYRTIRSMQFPREKNCKITGI